MFYLTRVNSYRLTLDLFCYNRAAVHYDLRVNRYGERSIVGIYPIRACNYDKRASTVVRRFEFVIYVVARVARRIEHIRRGYCKLDYLFRTAVGVGFFAVKLDLQIIFRQPHLQSLRLQCESVPIIVRFFTDYNVFFDMVAV